MAAEHCPAGHNTPTTAHRDAQGYCLACRREGTARRRRRASAALRVLDALRDHREVPEDAVDRLMS